MRRWPSFVLGLSLGAALSWAGQELVFLNWSAVVAPLDQVPLVLRSDAKGDGRFGAPRSGGRRHQGVDLEAPLGSAVRAVRSGVVVASGTHRGLGRYLELQHRHGVHSLYAHLDAVSVEVGQRVRQGEVIATVGNTGNARHPWIKPHLHLEVRQGGSPVDPSALGLSFVEPLSAGDVAVRRREG